jgi:hypothetical protein
MGLHLRHIDQTIDTIDGHGALAAKCIAKKGDDVAFPATYEWRCLNVLSVVMDDILVATPDPLDE